MAVIATGFFDGVHQGHRLVLETLVSSARSRAEEALVITFWPHPRAVLQDDARSLGLLTSQEEKISMLRQAGVDDVKVLPFDRKFASCSTREFLRDVAIGQFGASTVIIGYDNRFGSDQLLPSESASIAGELGLDVVMVDNRGGVSSTKIRKAIQEGDVVGAAEMLGYAYFLSGAVVPGNQLGRTIGFPTANLKVREPLKILPAVGAYFSKVFVLGRELRGMTNIDPNGKIETHIFDFSEDIYGLDITVTFEACIRKELKFESFDQLKKQLLLDRDYCKNNYL